MRDPGVIEGFVVHRNRDVQLQSFGMQSVVELLDQRGVIIARFVGKGLDVEREALVLIGRQEDHHSRE